MLVPIQQSLYTYSLQFLYNNNNPGPILAPSRVFVTNILICKNKYRPLFNSDWPIKDLDLWPASLKLN